jgi:UDP-glucose:glycoprotein glucosyltransferase
VQVVLNPISVAAQRFIPILQRLIEVFKVEVTLYLTPVEYTNLPMKNYYTYVLPSLSFDQDGKLVAPKAIFTHLPPQRLLTLNLDVPSAWLVTPIEAVYDLDNLRMQDVPSGIAKATFELQHLVVEGNCFDISKHNRGPTPPRGVQLIISPLGNNNSTTTPYYGKKDTLVMANYGYFQLKGNPGFWNLKLKEESRSEQIYEVTGEVGYRLSPAHKVLSERLIPVDSFGNHMHQLRVLYSFS